MSSHVHGHVSHVSWQVGLQEAHVAMPWNVTHVSHVSHVSGHTVRHVGAQVCQSVLRGVLSPHGETSQFRADPFSVVYVKVVLSVGKKFILLLTCSIRYVYKGVVVCELAVIHVATHSARAIPAVTIFLSMVSPLFRLLCSLLVKIINLLLVLVLGSIDSHTWGNELIFSILLR